MKQEEKRERFKRLGTQRTNVVLQKIKVLSNCANRSAYEYSEDEIGKIFVAIENATKNARSKFYFPDSKNRFKL